MAAPLPAGPAPPASAPATADAERRRLGLGLALLLAWTTFTYAGVTELGLVWDDHGLRLPDPLDLRALLGRDLWASAPGAPVDSGYFRPVFLLGQVVDQALLGGSLAGAHLHSLGWHLLSVALVVRLLSGTLSTASALAAGAVFALHPVQSEAVSWLAARNDPMATALGLAALICVRPADTGGARLSVGAALAALAMLAKESVVVLPLLSAVLDRASGAPGTMRRHLALALGLGLSLGLRALVGVSAGGLPSAAGLELLRADPLALPAVLGAALTVAWPLAATRSLEWLSWEPGWRRGVGLGAWVLLVGLPLLLPAARRRLALTGLGWLVLALLPALVPIVDKGLIGERYLYLGLVGLGLWAAGVAGRAFPALVLAALLPWHLLVRERLPDWRDDPRFWVAAWQDTGTPYAGAGLGLRLGQAGRPAQALPLLVGALDQDPPAFDACAGLLDAAVRVQGVEAAEPLGRWAVGRGCAADPRHTAALAVVQAQLGQWERAERTLSLAGPDPGGRALVVRVALLLREGQEAEARSLWEASRDPQEVARQAAALLESAARRRPAIGPVPPSEP